MTAERVRPWLRRLERKLGWLAIPNIAILFTTLQVLGFFCIYSDPIWFGRLILSPEAIRAGELWRLVTFLALPITFSPLWFIFSLLFIYYTLNLIESQWGSFRTTLYFLVSVVVTIAFALGFDFPVESVQDFASTFFLAAASLYPELEIRLYFAIPVKMKFLGWLTLAYLAFRLLGSPWMGRLYLLAIYSNYALFFGPAALSSLKAWNRRRSFRNKFR